jgi:hypothetical protein
VKIFALLGLQKTEDKFTKYNDFHSTEIVGVERDLLSLVRIMAELLERKNSGSVP